MDPGSGKGLLHAIRPKKVQISEGESLQLTRNLIRVSLFSITYFRGLFPESYFEERYLAALEMKIKKLTAKDLESKRLLDWMENGVFDALKKKYLKTVLFRLCVGECGPMIEEYAFSFGYSGSSEFKSMNITLSSQESKAVVASSQEFTPSGMKSTACKMVRTLVQLIQTLDVVPDQRVIVMKLYYRDDVTPKLYEPPYFRPSTYDDDNLWSRLPLKMKVGNVDSKYHLLSLKARSTLDLDIDLNDVVDEVHSEEMQKSNPSPLVSHKPPSGTLVTRTEVADTQLESLPSPSVTRSHKTQDENQDLQDQLYRKALLQVLPLDYITVPQLRSKLGNQVTAHAVRKLIDRMGREGYVAAASKIKRLGRQVLRKHLAKNPKLPQGSPEFS